MAGDHSHLALPSPWVVRWTHLLQPGAKVLDVACGSGRHLKWFSDAGFEVYGVDRDIAQARIHAPAAKLLEADIERGPWPLRNAGKPQQFEAVVVTNYLWRPLLDTLLASLAPNGVLLYETFAWGNGVFGRPARPEFLLRDRELLEICAGLHVVAYESGFLPEPDRVVQRIAAVKPGGGDAPSIEGMGSATGSTADAVGLMAARNTAMRNLL